VKFRFGAEKRWAETLAIASRLDLRIKFYRAAKNKYNFFVEPGINITTTTRPI